MSSQLIVAAADATAVGRQHVTFLLEKRGHIVRTANCAADLLAGLDPTIDLVLIHLPLVDADAEELPRQIRRLAPLALLFALGAVRAEGFDETLIAPLNPADLDEALRNMTQPIVDVPRLMEMLDNNRDLLKQLLNALGPAVESGIAGMRAAIEAGDSASLAGMAHRLKGSLCNLAADEAVAAARWLEELGKGRDLGEGRVALAKLDRI